MRNSMNPYDPPKLDSQINVNGVGASVKMYSPIQARIGAGLGGPLAATYILRSNFIALEKRDFAAKTMMFGLLLTIFVFAIVPFIPDGSGVLMGLIYIIITNAVMKNRQLDKEQIESSSVYTFKSNWNVAGVTIIAISTTMLFLLLLALAFPSLGQ